ncbi:MAG TPA: maleylpyruvate isomerase family mycothiol-dependent enzyme [Actinomycetota bacterium]|nr:maleylpyruvate isomerase family mycothiol-dependent enzyme [Actinomycetota bacterium]
MPDLAAAYEDARAAMIDLARTTDETARVPACPDWTVHDLIAHVTSIASELSSGGVPADLNLVQFWDDEMSRRRERFIDDALAKWRGRPLDDLVARWDTAATRLTSMIRGETPFPPGSPPLVDWVVVTDIGQHLQDLAGAIGTTSTRDSLATGLSLRSYVEAMRFRSAHDKLPAFRIRAGARQWVIGDGEPIATVTADPFELARAAAGRRSPDQIRAYDWDGDPEPFLVMFYPYGLRENALVE